MSLYAPTSSAASAYDPTDLSINLPTDVGQVDVSATPSLTDVLSAVSAHEPIIPNLPRAEKSFRNKYAFAGDYAPLASVLASAPSPVLNALTDLDQQRVLRGQPVLSTEDTIAAVNTVTSGQQVTPESKKNLLLDLPGAAVRDLRDILTSLPRLPFQLVKEATNIGDFGQEYRKQIEAGANPVEALAKSPGLRLIPGAFTVGNVAGGHFEEIARHPLMTALDVAPYAAKGIAAAKANPMIAAKMEAARTSVPVQMAENSTIGLGLRKAFGKQARDTSYIAAVKTKMIGDWMDPAQPLLPDWLERAATGEVRFRDKVVEAKLNKAITTFAQTYEPAVDVGRMAEITTAAQLGRAEDLAALNLTDFESAMLTDYKTLQTQLQDYALTRTDIKDGIVQVENLAGAGDAILPSKSALKVHQRRTVARFYRDMSLARDMMQNGVPLDVPAIRTMIDDYVVSGNLPASTSRSMQRRLLDNAATALEANDIVPREFRQAITDVFQKKGDPNTLLAALDADVARPVGLSPAQNVAGIRQWMDEMVNRGVDAHPQHLARLDKIQTLIDAEAFAQARKELTKFQASVKNYMTSVPENVAADIRFGIKQAKQGLKRRENVAAYLDKTQEFTAKSATRMETRAAKYEERIVPAVNQPLVDRTWRDRIKVLALDYENPEAIRSAIEDRNYSAQALVDAGMDLRMVRRVQRDAVRTVLEMRRAAARGELDYAPVFVHRTDPSFAKVINYATIRNKIPTPSQLRARTMDVSPSYDSLTINLSHQGVEWLTRRSTEELFDWMGKSAEEGGSGWTRRLDDLQQEYLPIAKAKHARRPDMSVMTHVSKELEKSWVQFDPNKHFSFMPKRVTGMPSETIMIPRVVDDVLTSFFESQPGFFTKATAPLMNAFRVSVLPLSPRWHINNVLGGMVMMMARTDPFTVWKHLGRAREMLRTPESIPELLRGELGNAKLYQHDLAVSSGGRLAEMMADFKANHPGVGKVTDAAGNVITKSYEFNQIVDDMYRVMSYLYGKDKEFIRLEKAKGIPSADIEAASIKAGVELSRKIMPDWNSMTPFERNVIRGIVPFYGFMSHVLRYVYSYPIDHPVRASIVANFAEAEIRDMGEATPRQFLGLLGVGGTDEKGGRRYTNTRGLNPFADTANLFTIAGFLQTTNPVITTILQSVGIDPTSGTADIYPDVKYDAATGRLALKTSNPLTNLFANTLPQPALLAQLLNPTSDLNRLRMEDPEIASAMARSAMGLPNFVRRRNLTQEQMKAEVNRREVARQNASTAVKTGVYGDAMANPAARAYLSQLNAAREQNPNAYAAYDPAEAKSRLGIEETRGTGAIAVAQKTLLGALGIGL